MQTFSFPRITYYRDTRGRNNINIDRKHIRPELDFKFISRVFQLEQLVIPFINLIL